MFRFRFITVLIIAWVVMSSFMLGLQADTDTSSISLYFNAGDGALSIWDLEADTILPIIPNLTWENEAITDHRFLLSPDYRHVVSITLEIEPEDSTQTSVVIYIPDNYSGEMRELLSINRPSASIYDIKAVSWSPDGSYIAIYEQLSDQFIVWLLAENGDWINQIVIPDTFHRGTIIWSTDSERLYIVGVDDTVLTIFSSDTSSDAILTIDYRLEMDFSLNSVTLISSPTTSDLLLHNQEEQVIWWIDVTAGVLDTLPTIASDRTILNIIWSNTGQRIGWLWSDGVELYFHTLDTITRESISHPLPIPSDEEFPISEIWLLDHPDRLITSHEQYFICSSINQQEYTCYFDTFSTVIWYGVVP